MIYEPQTLLEHIFILVDHPMNAEKGTYIPSLVVLSYIIAVIGSFTSLSVLDELWLARTERKKTYLHIVSALTLGVGVWSMHFVGMLAYDMEMVHSYDLGTTLISMLIAAIVAYGFIYIVRNRKPSILTYVLGSCTLGLAICGMHYTGMAAMEMDAAMLYEPGKFILSVLIAVIASAAAIWIIYRLKSYDGLQKRLWQTLASLIIGAAICGMHYTGMAATVFLPFANCRFDPDQTYYTLAGVVALISGTIFIGAIALNIAQKSYREQGQYSKSWNAIPFMIAVFGVLVTVFSALALQNYNTIQNKQRLDVLVADTQGALQTRYEIYLQALRGGLGLFEASNFVDRQEWKAFVDAQNIAQTLPGINGIGFIEYVKATELEGFLQKTKEDNAPDFKNHPDTDFDDKFVIKYIEPVAKNYKAVGLDIGFEQNRRTAAEYSIKMAEEAVTKKIELVQDNKKRAGFLLLLPLYSSDMPTVTAQERIKAILGWVYAPFIGEYFLQDLNNRELAYAVYDGSDTVEKNLIYKSPDFQETEYEEGLSKATPLMIAGRTWTILWHATASFEHPGNKNLPLIDFILGLFITTLIAGMTYSLNQRGHVVQKLVDERTAELQEVNAELEEFAYRTSHDLRSPIISSVSLLELANSMIENDQPDDAKESLSHAKNSLERLRVLIDDILQLTVIRNKDEENVQTSIEQTINEALDKFSNMDGIEKLDIQKDLNFEDVIMTKRLRFSMIVENLISNAIKYQNPDADMPFVKISTYEQANNFVLEVTDNGMGIPKDQREDLFKMFKRFHPKVAYGSGLGLYLLKKSTDVLGGDIEYNDPGSGSTFKLKLNKKQVQV